MFKFKNETNKKIYLAFGYPIPPYSSPIWVSEGWWHIDPGVTAIVYAEKLDSRYYYYYAHDGGTLQWSGDTVFNVSNLAFKLKRPSECINTYDTKLFELIDTGTSRDFSVHLTGNSSSPISEDEKEIVKWFQEFKNKNK
jgi:uncharacterized membrane protein